MKRLGKKNIGWIFAVALFVWGYSWRAKAKATQKLIDDGICTMND